MQTPGASSKMWHDNDQRNGLSQSWLAVGAVPAVQRRFGSIEIVWARLR